MQQAAPQIYTQGIVHRCTGTPQVTSQQAYHYTTLQSILSTCKSGLRPSKRVSRKSVGKSQCHTPKIASMPMRSCTWRGTAWYTEGGGKRHASALQEQVGALSITTRTAHGSKNAAYIDYRLRKHICAARGNISGPFRQVRGAILQSALLPRSPQWELRQACVSPPPHARIHTHAHTTTPPTHTPLSAGASPAPPPA